MNEIWKDIPGYEGYYQVSSIGNVRSLDRISEQGRPLLGIGLVQMVSAYGYMLVNLHKNKKQKSVKVHRLVAYAFLPNPSNKPQINHKNGVKTDNRVGNLEWCTIGENNVHAWCTGLKKPSNNQKMAVSYANSGSKSHRSRVVLNKESGIFYETLNDAAFSVGIKPPTLGAMLRGEHANRTNLIYV